MRHSRIQTKTLERRKSDAKPMLNIDSILEKKSET